MDSFSRLSVSWSFCCIKFTISFGAKNVLFLFMNEFPIPHILHDWIWDFKCLLLVFIFSRYWQSFLSYYMDFLKWTLQLGALFFFFHIVYYMDFLKRTLLFWNGLFSWGHYPFSFILFFFFLMKWTLQLGTRYFFFYIVFLK